MIDTWRATSSIANTVISKNVFQNSNASKMSTLTIKSTNITRNVASASLILIENMNFVGVIGGQKDSKFTFINNKAIDNDVNGDIIHSFASNSFIKNNLAEQNTFKSFIFSLKSNCNITSLKIKGNKALGFGKTIHFNKERISDLSLNLTNVSCFIEGNNDGLSETTIFDVKIHHGSLYMNDISIVLSGLYTSVSTPVINLSLDSRHAEKSHPQATIQCPNNHYPTSAHITSDRVFEFQYLCQPCGRGLYNLKGGTQSINGTLTATKSESFWIN